jgi:hypothetical protein
MLRYAQHLAAERARPIAINSKAQPCHAERHPCHAERSEASRCRARQPLRLTQGDTV